MRHKSVNTPLSHERLVGSLQDGGRGTHVTHFVQLYPQPLYTASQVRMTSCSWDKGVLTDSCLTRVLTDLCLTLYNDLVHLLISNISQFHIFSSNVSSCSQFVEACFGPFSAQLAKVGSYRALEKEAQDLIGALHEKLERRRRDLQTGLGVGVRSKIKLTTLELKVCYISVELIFTFQ